LQLRFIIVTRALLSFTLLICDQGELRAAEPAPKPTAHQLLVDAFAKAKREGKSVFIIFGNHGCTPCRLFDAYHAAPEVQYVLSKHVVYLKVDTEKTPGAEELIKRLGGSMGMPAWWILPADGTTIPGAGRAKGSAGFPAGPSERLG